MQVIEIIKYKNRKLYCLEQKRTVYLSDIREYTAKGVKVRVIDHEYQTDITAQTLAQAVAYSQKPYKQTDLENIIKENN